jgi:hypothetical protein
MDFTIVLAALAAIAFFRMGQYEARDGRRSNGPLWALLSVAVSWLAMAAFDAGVPLEALGQVGLFVAIGIFRAVREP